MFAAYAIDSGIQDVVRGENKGRRLHHVAIAKELTQLSQLEGSQGGKPFRISEGHPKVFTTEKGVGDLF